MFAEIVAMGSAMGWAADSVLVRFGLRNSNIFAAKTKRIGGLVGSYFINCVRAAHHSGGGGSISNG